MKAILSIRTIFFLLLAGFSSVAPAQQKPIPRLVKTGSKVSLIVDGKPFIMLGGQVGNNSATQERMAHAWPKLKAYHANTVEFPVYWKTIEPQEGKFDFSDFDNVLKDCRAQGLKAVLLWFGSNKCGKYLWIPSWVKQDSSRFPKMMDINGNTANSIALSLHSKATLDVELKAYTAFMKHLSELDKNDRTVILMQVENEPGLLGSVRDFSAATNRLFNGPVPAKLTAALRKKAGTWKAVFGPRLADETFSAYYMADYMNKLAVAGKRIYPIPTYVNVWMGGQGTNDRFNEFDRPGDSYPSGGPVSHLIDVWKAAAPDIDIIAPDIYHQSSTIYRTILTRYTRPDNPLLIVETGQGMVFARNCFYALADYSALGFAQYGIDGGGSDAVGQGFTDVGANFRLIKPAIPVIARLQGTNKLKAAVEEEAIPSRMLYFDNYDILTQFPLGMNDKGGAMPLSEKSYIPSGRVLFAQLQPDEFLILGFNALIDFKPPIGSGFKHARFLSVEEGIFENGVWKTTASRDIKPDARDLKLSAEGTMLKVKLTRN